MPTLTSVGSNILPSLLSFPASNGIFACLDLQNLRAVLAAALAGAEGVHGALKGIVLPAEEVVTMSSVSGASTRVSFRLY